MLTKEVLIERLGLSPLPGEGGFYRETYRSPLAVKLRSGDVTLDRRLGTAIYYLITETDFSALHRLKFDEIFHFYLGDPVEMTRIDASGKLEKVILGSDLSRNHVLQSVVPAGAWQGTRLVPGGHWALLGTTMAAGFEFADFELASRDSLIATYPAYKGEIVQLTRGS